ncbi:MAG: permease [Sporomusaceae bacterium]|nr:permease [Sporomusaceae bacterium]
MPTTAAPHIRKLILLCLLALTSLTGFADRLFAGLSAYPADILQETAVIFLSIIIEAFPLVLLGVLASSLLHVFVSDAAIHRLLPKNSLAGIAGGSLLGLLFPLCECGIVPIVRRLIQKGVPHYIAVPFMLAAPVINPLVGFSTYLAFNNQPAMLIYRLGGAFLAANLTGLLLAAGQRKPVLRAHRPACCHDGQTAAGGLARLQAVLSHSVDEFFDMGRFLIIGSLLAALIQAGVPRSLLLSLGQDPVVSVAGMMGFAFVISVCSQADAFIAAPFAAAFTPGAIAAFLIYGPMLDIKNMVMLVNTFKSHYTLKLVVYVSLIVFIISLLINYAAAKGGIGLA